MATSQKLCLNWKNFHQNISNAFRDLRSGDDFADVTLACEDGQMISAHKVILASSSPFFMNILKTFKNPHPLIFIRGVKSEELSAIVDFLYFGETNVEQENIEAFLALADDLKILGLSRAEGLVKKADEIPPAKGKGPLPTVKEEDYNLEDNGPHSPLETSIAQSTDDNHGEAGMPKLEMPKLETLTGEDIRTKVMSMMEYSKNLVMSSKKPGSTLGRARICKVCGKEGTHSTVWNHIEAKHLENSYSCNRCEKTTKSRNGLATHKSREHTK